jgi:hypothetical protein
MLSYTTMFLLLSDDYTCPTNLLQDGTKHKFPVTRTSTVASGWRKFPLYKRICAVWKPSFTVTHGANGLTFPIPNKSHGTLGNITGSIVNQQLRRSSSFDFEQQLPKRRRISDSTHFAFPIRCLTGAFLKLGYRATTVGRALGDERPPGSHRLS